MTHTVQEALAALGKKGCKSVTDIDNMGNPILKWLYVPLGPELGNKSWGRIDYLARQHYVVLTFVDKNAMRKHLELVANHAQVR